MSERLELNGRWQRSVGGRMMDYVAVPGSYPPVGECLLEHEFEAPDNWLKNKARVFLCTEGVLASAAFTLNDTPLGTAGPWVPYCFELPPDILKRRNVIKARVRDVVNVFGGIAGRRFDGGLARPVYLERRPACFIENIMASTELDAADKSAWVIVTVELNGASSAPVEITLKENPAGRVAARASGNAPEPIALTIERPRLWTPDSPNLYTLEVKLDGAEGETYRELIGFRRLEIRGQDFFLNNQRLILKGVCRHEFNPRSGYTPSETEIRHDLALIKQAGFNFVRLVHSPPSAFVPRFAAEIGLFVSEEPGLSWQDQKNETIAAGALEVLRRVILRDRNLPSLFAWLIYNECAFEIPYAVRAAELCRNLDPDRFTAMADHASTPEQLREMAGKAGLSFYGVNRYSFDPQTYTETMKALADRPLLITEWGGWYANGNERVLRNLCSMWTNHLRADAQPRAAGCCYWVWQDYEEYGRPGPGAIDGWTIEGLLDRNGNPKPDLQALSQMCRDVDHPAPKPYATIQVLYNLSSKSKEWHPLSLDGIGEPETELETDWRSSQANNAWQMPAWDYLLAGGIEFRGRKKGMLLLGKGREEIVIPVGRKITGIAVLGHADIKGGYPDARIDRLGQPASEYEFHFADESVEVCRLLHGVHVLRANIVLPPERGRGWRACPEAPEIIPALQIELDPSFETLRLNLWQKKFTSPAPLTMIRWRLKDPESVQLLAAISLQEK